MIMKFKKTTKTKLAEFASAYRTSKRLLGVLWHVDKKLFTGNLLTILVPGVTPFVNAYIYKLIIDYIVRATSGHPVDHRYLLMLIGARIVSLFIQDAAYTAQRYYDLLMWTKLPVHLYQEVLSKLSALDLEYFENSAFKDQLEKVRESYSWRPLNMISQLFYSAQSLLQVLIATVAIITLNWSLAIAIIIVAIPTLLYQAKYAGIIWGIWDNNSPHRKRFWYLADIIQNGQSVKEIKLFQLRSTFLDQISDIYQKFVKENVGVARKQYYTGLAIGVLNIGMYAIIEIFIIFAALGKRITIGSITYFTSVLNNFQSGVNGLFRNLSLVFDQSQYIRSIFEVLDTETKIPAPAQPIKLDTKRVPKIEFKNVSFSYPGTTAKVLDGFSMTIEPGQKVAFVGENGAGKTTLVKLLGRFYDVDGGEILIDGTNIKQLDLPTWYQMLGVLFQDFIKYEYPLRDNIHFGNVSAPNEIASIIKAAHQSGADSVAEQLPDQYDQMLGKTFEGGTDLSTGQWQKVALARGFYRDASVLILDEPTAAIDAKAESEIFERVEQLAEDKTVLIISHRFSTVRNADKIYVLESGKIKESGSHEELMKQAGTYATLFSLQAKGYQ